MSLKFFILGGIMIKNLMKVIFYLGLFSGAFILGLEGCSNKSSSNKEENPPLTEDPPLIENPPLTEDSPLSIFQLGNVTKGFPNGDNSQNDFCYSIAVDSSDNVYCAGSTSGALGEAQGGESDVFVMKLDSSGSIQWVTQLGETTKGFVGGDNSQYEACYSIAVDSSDNVYCAGYTSGALGEAHGGESDVFVMKLDSSGSIQWVTQLGETTKGFVGGDNSQDEACYSIAVDSSDNVYCAGSTSGALGEANGEAQGGTYDAFVMKLDSSGSIQWVTQLGETTKGFVGGDNSQDDSCYSIAVDSSDNVYCAGDTYDGALGEAQGGGYDAFVMKLDSSGALQWVTQLGETTKGFVGGDNSQRESCNSIAMDSSDNVYCAGSTSGALGEANRGEEDAFVMKLDSSGSIQWVTQLGETTKGFVGGDNSQEDSCRSIAVDSSDNVYCAGSTTGALGEANGGNYDAFVMKLDSSGALQWVTQLGETTKGFFDGGMGDNSQSDFCNSIAVDSSDNVYCAGSTSGALGEAHGGGADLFVMKLTPP